MNEPRRIGVTEIRYMTARQMRELNEPLLIQPLNQEPVAVLVPYKIFMDMQRLLIDMQRAILRS